MSDVNCPRCGDSFRLPDVEIPADAAARCPWCMDLFPVSQLMSALPPMAQLIDSSGQVLPAGQPQTAAAGIRWEGEDAVPGPPAASELADRADDEPATSDDTYLLSDDVSDETSELAGPGSAAAIDGEVAADEPPEESYEQQFDDSFEFAQPATGAEFAAPVEPRPLHDVSSDAFGREDRTFVAGARAKKKGTSPLKSLLGIVAGGVLAIPLAAIILALLGRPVDLGFWPFDGKTITTGSTSRTAAPVMPQEAASRPGTPPRQGRSLADDLPGANDPRAQVNGSPPDPDSGAAGAEDRNGTGPRGTSLLTPQPSGPELIEPVVEDDEAMVSDLTADARDADTALDTELQDAVVDSAPESAAVPPMVVAEETAADDANAGSDPAASEAGRPAQPPQDASSPELQAALEAADDALQAMASHKDQQDALGYKPRLATLYAGIAAVGDLARPQDEPELIRLIDHLSDANLIKDLGAAAPTWAKYPRRPNDGMFAVGALRRDEQKWFLDWSGPAPLEIRLSPDAATPEEHSQVIVMGRLLSDDASPAVEAVLLKPLE